MRGVSVPLGHQISSKILKHLDDRLFGLMSISALGWFVLERCHDKVDITRKDWIGSQLTQFGRKVIPELLA